MTIHLKGFFADATFDPASGVLTIERGMGHKAGRGTASVPVTSIAAVNMQEPTRMRPVGFIEFVGSGLGDAQADSYKDGQDQVNVVTFKRKRADIAVQIRDAIHASKSAGSRPPPSAGGSTAEELTKLAGLRDAGVLSEDEFAAEKAKLLG